MLSLKSEPKYPLVYYVKSGVLFKKSTNTGDTDSCAVVKIYKKENGTYNDEARLDYVSVKDGNNDTIKYYLDEFIEIGDIYTGTTTSNKKFKHVTHKSGTETSETLTDYYQRICKEALIQNIGAKYDSSITVEENYNAICRDKVGNTYKFSPAKIEKYLGIPYWMVKDVKSNITITPSTAPTSGTLPLALALSDYKKYIDEYCTIKLNERANELKKGTIYLLTPNINSV